MLLQEISTAPGLSAPLLDRTSCTETSAKQKKRSRGVEEEDPALADFRALASVVVELEKLVERRGKRLCSFRQSGPCSRRVHDIAQTESAIWKYIG